MNSHAESSIVCIICARGGSQGVPGKNIRPLAGKPLLAWTIETARKCGFLKRIVVSTDSPEIARVAREYGAEVPLLRPAELATAEIGKLPALQHMVQHLESTGEHVNVVVDLDPTCPLREISDVAGAVERLTPDTGAVITVFEPHHNPYWTLFEPQGQYLTVSKTPDRPISCRQQLPPVYAMTGNTVVSWRETIMANGGYFAGRFKGHCIPAERAIDIDTELEFDLCEMLLRKRRPGEGSLSCT